MPRPSLAATLLTTLVLPAALVAAAPPGTNGAPGSPAQEAAIEASLLEALEWRSIGPAIMGGRATATAGIPGNPATFYIAYATGGIHKTVDGGVAFEPIFDEVGVPSIGDIALAPSDPNVIYVGTGEGNPRNSTSVGRGMYRSVDAGENWTFLGLETTERFTRIQVHPTDPDVVYAAALGHEWGANEERGVYRSTDGGDTWERVLYVDENTGAADLRMDPSNPRILFAAMYDFRRWPWTFRSGGPGSGLYRSADGGDTWTELTAGAPDNGLPAGVLGRIGIAVAPSEPQVVYAMIESNADGELWRSDDGGETWRVVSDDSNINNRPFYFSDLRVDPRDAERVYSLAGRLMLSEDGGRTFRTIGGDFHPDNHAMWIDPVDPDRIIEGNDGGFYVSRNQGETWEYLNVIPTGQFYQIGVDMRDPYRVCGGLQDNGVWCGPSATRDTAGLLNDNWYIVHFGDGYYTQIDPEDWSTIYTNAHYGNIVRVDAETGEKQSIQPYPASLRGAAAGDHPYRFNWNSPVHMSPNDADRVYFGSNVLFRTTDGGHTWEEISPDLTTNDPEKLQPSGGPITTDNTSAEYHCTIVTVAESPADPQVIWAGTDDGNVQVTRDGGDNWTNVVANVPGLPPESWVSRVEASRVDAGTAYVTFDRHRLDDMQPYVYKTTDYGSTWTDLGADLPDYGFLHVVREDPRNPELLYVGSEFGLFASLDGGGSWISLHAGDLPPVPVRDIVIHPRDNDLVAGTHGRSIWILDDLTPLQQLARGGEAAGAAASEEPALFEPPRATRYQPRFNKPFLAHQTFHGDNDSSAARISYWLPAELAAAAGTGTGMADTGPADGDSGADGSGTGNEADIPEVQLTVEDGAGNVVRTLEPTRHHGMNRVLWDLGYDPLGEEQEGAFLFGFEPVPLVRVLPGTYTVRLRAEDREITAPVTVRLDPEVEVSDADLQAQHEATMRLRRMGHEADEAVATITDLQEQLRALGGKLESVETSEDFGARVETLVDDLEELRVELVSEPGGYRSPARLRGHIERLLGDIGTVHARPTAAQSEFIDRFDGELQDVLGRLESLIDGPLAGLDRDLNAAGVPRIVRGGQR